MYGVPRDLDLSRFVGATMIQICLGPAQVQFHLQAEGCVVNEGLLYIDVEGRWELQDRDGHVIDGVERGTQPDVHRVHRLLGRVVSGAEVNAPESFSLRFDQGDTLRIFDDSAEYESFSIQPGDIFV